MPSSSMTHRKSPRSAAHLDWLARSSLGSRSWMTGTGCGQLDPRRGLQNRGLAEEALTRGGPTAIRRSRRSRRARWVDRSAPPAPRPVRALSSSLQKGHCLQPLCSPEGSSPCERGRLALLGRLVIGLTPELSRYLVTAVARRRTSCETWASRLLRTNGTPRFSA